MVEGEVMIDEALKCGLIAREGIVEEGREALAQPLVERGVRVAVVPRSLLEGVCETKTPQGVCAAFDIPSPLPPEAASRKGVPSTWLLPTAKPGSAHTSCAASAMAKKQDRRFFMEIIPFPDIHSLHYHIITLL